MRAGFARVKINPAVGTAMTGFGSRDRQPARFVKGIDETLRRAVRELQEAGIK